MVDRTTVRLPEDLLARARRKAAREGRTLTSLIEDGLRLVVAEKPVQPKRKFYPRVSKATGGVRPGVNLDHYSSIVEMQDIEYMEHMKQFE